MIKTKLIENKYIKIFEFFLDFILKILFYINN